MPFVGICKSVNLYDYVCNLRLSFYCLPITISFILSYIHTYNIYLFYEYCFLDCAENHNNY